ncbi:Predicted arabinose efflux permease, MFS family [Geodermatophilus pulveris]|uniref:Predicted arabinose efflux permease, MFS family n=1 Tax=Geodermatophilus pulveris TaxID=1564159 RepID=A0A239DZR1_9ACTN|nr:MFS transporter [Geodermatophilus pulveris]SNS37192.1 Predicted arabinose efflux permease, MFS family [Geodermatophilus pulveris]
MRAGARTVADGAAAAAAHHGGRRGRGPLNGSAPAGGRPTGAAPRPATFRGLFAAAEFRPLFGTYLLSTIGDELARVALTVLVFQRTDSPLLSAITFAISYLPWLLGGPLLSTLADRFPRHRVLIATDVARAVLVAGMALPGTPLPVLLGLLLVVALCGPPFESARSALMADVLDGDRYALATSLTNVSSQVAQVLGFVLGGALVAVFDPSAALLVDAATFAVSAVWLWARLARRPAPDDGGDATGPRSMRRDATEGLRLIGRTPRLRAIIAVTWVGTLFGTAPEGVAAPLVAQLGQGPAQIGVLLAANPAGVTVGGLLIARALTQQRREQLVPALVVLSLVPVVLAGLVTVWGAPGQGAYAAVVALLFVAGLGAAWTIPLNVAFVQAVPSAYRGRAFGVAVSGLYGVQGIGVLAAGAAAEGVPTGVVVAAAGALGLLAVASPLLGYVRTQGHVAAAPPPAGRSGA